MIMKANKQIGFIYKDNESIDKILKDGDVVFERGFLRERTTTTLPITFGGVGKGLKDYKIYGNTKQQLLPNGYTQIDYIESSGTQYIDTGFKPNQDTIVEFKSIITQVGSSYGFYGARKETSSSDSYVLLASRYYNNNTSYQFNYGGGGGVVDLNIPNTNINKYLENKNELYINDNLQITRPIATFSTNYNLYLMAVNTSNAPTLHAYGRLYYFKIYDNNVLARDFIPCYRNSDNEVGLYDLVNNVFYTNQGTGVFTYGSVAPTPDAPIEVVSCGDRTKNLFDKNTTTKNEFLDSNGNIVERIDNVWYLSDYIPVNPNENYTYQGLTFVGTAPYSAYYDINKNFISTFKQAVGQNTILIPNNAYYVRFSIINRELNQDLPTFMIEKGSIATDYEPYYEGYKIPVNVRSENLFDKNDITLEKRLDPNGIFYNDTGYYTTSYIEVSPNTQYAKNSPSENAYHRICFYDTNKSFISASNSNVYATPSNTKYIRFCGLRTELNSAMYVIGSTVPSKYQSYYNETTNIYLDEPLRKIGEYSDYIDFINGKAVRQLGEVILNGSEDIVRNNTNTTGKYRFSLGFTNINMITVAGAGDINPILSDKYISKNRNQTYANATGIGYGTGSTTYKNIILYDKNLSSFTTEQFKTWLQSNNVIVDYVLATPTEESITLPNIPTVDGNNTLNIETEITPSQVYIKYKSNS